MATPTTDQLREQIDSGQTGEKHGAVDPAAAPLGTDAEAGGTPPTPGERKVAAATAPKAHHEHGFEPNGPALLLLAIVLIGIVLLAIVTMARG